MARKDYTWKKQQVRICSNCIKFNCIIHEALPNWNKGCSFWVRKGKFIALLKAIRKVVDK